MRIASNPLFEDILEFDVKIFDYGHLLLILNEINKESSVILDQFFLYNFKVGQNRLLVVQV